MDTFPFDTSYWYEEQSRQCCSMLLPCEAWSWCPVSDFNKCQSCRKGLKIKTILTCQNQQAPSSFISEFLHWGKTWPMSPHLPLLHFQAGGKKMWVSTRALETEHLLGSLLAWSCGRGCINPESVSSQLFVYIQAWLHKAILCSTEYMKSSSQVLGAVSHEKLRSLKLKINSKSTVEVWTGRSLEHWLLSVNAMKTAK